MNTGDQAVSGQFGQLAHLVQQVVGGFGDQRCHQAGGAMATMQLHGGHGLGAHREAAAAAAMHMGVDETGDHRRIRTQVAVGRPLRPPRTDRGNRAAGDVDPAGAQQL